MIESVEKRVLYSTTYYVASSTPGIDTVDEKWISVEQVQQRAAANGFAAGDAILFESGAAFVLPQPSAGESAALVFDSAESGIRVGSFGGGRATLMAGAAGAMLFVNAADVTVSDLVLLGNGSQTPMASSGVEFRTVAAAGVGPDTKFANVQVLHVEAAGFGDYGIELAGTYLKSGFQNVVIDGVKARANTNGGIASTGAWDPAATTYAHANVTVTRSVAQDNPGFDSPNHSGDGIVMADVQGLTIEYCEAFNNGFNNTHVGGPVGIWVWDVDRALIQYNESHHNRTNSTADGGGFDFDGGVTNSVMQYNYSHHNDGAGYGIYQFQGARPFYNNDVRYNLSVDDGRKNSYGAIDFWNGNGTNGIFDTRVYNNTVLVSPSTETRTTYDRKGRPVTSVVKLGDPRALRFISGTNDVSIRNNIFHVTGDVMLAQIDARHNNLQLQGNNWSAPAATFKIKYFSKVYTTFDAYVKATGQEKIGNAVVGRSVNPGLVNSAAAVTVGLDRLATMSSYLGEFRLSGSSPLLLPQNAGIDLLASFSSQYKNRLTAEDRGIGLYDFFGNDLLASGRYAIGMQRIA